MIKRILSPLNSSSFFLFGARGTGKSTYLKAHYQKKNTLYIDLLNPDLENRYSLKPQSLKQEILALQKKPDWIILDEIQKTPKLLDSVHQLIEDEKLKFILTGSSARKLKRNAANMLAGRAFVYNLYPFSILELSTEKPPLSDLLRWGSLPRLHSLSTDREKKSFLNAYIQTYFAEEIRAEQLVRKLNPFRAFLPILGQSSGKIINHYKIAKEVGVSSVTIQNYFQIVEDTLLGFYLPAFHLSVRKSQLISPKFYLIDNGMKKALEESLDQAVLPRTSVYGELFESFFINEIVKLNSYYEKGFRLSFLATKNGNEVDLILSKNSKNIAIEIKSASTIDESRVKSLEKLTLNIPGIYKTCYISQSQNKEKIGQVECWHYLDFLKHFSKL